MADFFEKIAKNIDKGVKTVSSKGKEFVEVTKLKNEIRRIEESIQEQFKIVGQHVFDMFNKENFNSDELKNECAEIRILFKEIVKLKEEIKKVEEEALKIRYGQNVVVCSACGKNNKLGDKFCSSCGASFQEETITNEPKCPGCNSSLKEGTKFCFRCGQKVA